MAPVDVADGAYVAAGSTITKDVPPGELAVARGKQRNIDGWVARRQGRHPYGGGGRAGRRTADEHSDRREVGRMSFIKTTGEKKLMLFAGRAHPELAEEVAKELGIELTPTTAYDFANGEIFVRYQESVRGCDAFVMQSHAAPLNKWIMEQLIMVDALKRASAKRITVVMPFYGYARQDKKHRGREPISARLVADLFKTAGADRLMAVDLHTAQIQGFFDGPVDHLFALPLLAGYVGRRVDRTKVDGRLPGRRPRPGRRALVRRPSAAPRWRSSTRAATRRCPTRPSPTGSSVTSRAAPASSSTT